VVSPQTFSLYERLDNRLKNLKGLTLNLRDGHVVVEGRLLRLSDWQAIADVAQSYPAEYDFAAHPLADVAEEALPYFVRLAHSAGLPTPRLIADPNLTVSLPAGSEIYQKIADKTFSPYGVKVRVTPSQVRVMPLVRTRVILAEISSEVSRTFGVQFPNGYQAKLLPKLETPEDLSVQLNALETKGLAKVLASPNLLCRSGSAAEFLAGGEFPVRTSKIFAGEVAWKQHGVVLKVKPMADGAGSISLDIETEVSLLDKANAVENVPALKTNRVHSHFDIAGRKTVALSGLLREDWGLNREGLAGLASLPILGALFRSQSFQARKSELVVFVTPEVLLPEFEGDDVKMPQGWSRDDL
jgi:pilus assembly protein CpaC